MEGSAGAAAANGFQVFVKPVGAICNLDCTYCYFLAKERMYPGSRFRMADELLEEYMRQYMNKRRKEARAKGLCPYCNQPYDRKPKTAKVKSELVTTSTNKYKSRLETLLS